AEDQKRQIIPQTYQTVALAQSQLTTQLTNAPLRFSPEAQQIEVVLDLPMPDGSIQQFEIQEAPVMHPKLGARYPNMKSYCGKGIDDPTAYVRFDVTPNGFHGMVLSGRMPTAFIDPYAQGDTEHYISYYKKDYQKAENVPFVCEVEGGAITPGSGHPTAANAEVGDCQLRVYRLALACVGEYAQFHGSTIEGAMAAMVTTMTRVNGIYERDLGVTMEMVENNDLLIFLNPFTDPYSNTSGDLGANQSTCNSIIGSANFDVGHLLTTSGGGVAMLNAPCVNNIKARGLSGQGAPVGDPYDVDYVAHEMGHQFGGNHTQNNPCNRVGFAAVEPGSASTIMGYAGICNPNVQSNSDDHFHALNLQEMAANITFGNSSTCPATFDTGNTAPMIDAGANYTLPVLTPFTLTATAVDPDNDQLTYCWEQMNPEPAPMPPQPTSTQGPAFRSISPVDSPSRTFPNLTDLNNNVDPTWEELPAVSRTMNFRCTVRDNYMGAGCTDEDDVVVTFRQEAGPFLVLNPNTNITWTVGDFAEVNWDVANTDVAPISCANVNILLSTDGGLTYPIVLAENVANNGALLIEVPDQVGNNNRVKVVCADNIFFDISNTNFNIVAPTEPGIAVFVDPPTQTFCAASGPIDLTVNINALAGFNEMVDLTIDGVAANAGIAYSPSAQVTPPSVVTITISDPSVLPGGVLPVTVNVVGSTAETMETVELVVIPGVPEPAELIEPLDQAKEVSREPILTWAVDFFSDEYTIEIATNPSFEPGTIIETATLTEASYEPVNLQYHTVYYWRIQSSNLCGESVPSDFFSFQTVNPGCEIIQSEEIPLSIP
ncbi:MAG: reprolysin-like metallopeptidase, partial [Bacteroidota bacterium]